MLGASGANYAVNALTARWFDAQGFSDASLLVTLVMLVTIGAVALQLMASRRVVVGGDPDAAIGWLHTLARQIGLWVGGVLVVLAPLWERVFSTSSALPFVLLGLGVPLYLSQAVDRGVLQAELRFVALAGTFVVEAVIRLVATVVLVATGCGVSGVAGALSLSFVATWLVSRAAMSAARAPGMLPPGERAALLRDARLSVLLLAGQIVVNNGDLLIVKAFRPADAALYSAVALIGRAVFVCSWAVASVLFPLVARHDRAGGSPRRVALLGVGLVAAMGGAMTIGAHAAGPELIGLAVGPGYAGAAPLLWRYSLATTAFTITNLLASLDLAGGRRRGPWLVVVGAATQTGLLLVSRGPLGQLVDLQVAVMIALALVACGALAGRRPSPLHAIADPSDRAHAARSVAPVDLLAQVGDVDVDDVVVAEPVRSPHALAQRRSTEHHPRSLGERLEDVELDAGELDGLAGHLHVAGQGPEHEITEHSLVLAGRLDRWHQRGPGSSQQGFDAGAQLAG
jgi:O-antigen/teichoic acid export membrane protein